MTSKPNKRYSAPALDKGLDILEYLSTTSAPQTQSELIQALGRTQSEIYRMLECLVHRNFIAKDESTGAYSLTLKLYALSHRHNRTSLIRKAAAQPMEELAEATQQSCHLSLPYGSEILIVIERLPPRTVCLSVGEGSALSFSMSASGRMLLSRLPDDSTRIQRLKQDEAFRKLKGNAKKVLLEEIKDLSEQKGFIAQSKVTPGGIDLGTTIGVAETETFGALAMSYIEGEADLKRRDQYMKSLQQCAQRINQNLGLSS